MKVPLLMNEETKKTSTSKKEPLWLHLVALFAGMYLGIIIGVPIIYFFLIITA